jgi:hypothetical protein
MENEQQQQKKGSSRNRSAGHNFERAIVNTLKLSGFPNASTSRLCSRLKDSQKIDIVNADESLHGRLPYNIQAKCMATRLDYRETLDEIPLVEGIINVVLHKKMIKSPTGKTFQTKGHYAFMYQHDFFKMVKEIEELKQEVKQLKQNKNGEG